MGPPGWSVGPTGSGMESRLMMPHVPTGLVAAHRALSNAHGSALHRTYAGAVKKPTGNAATPSQSPCKPARTYPWHRPSPSPKYSMKEPPVRRGPLAEYPQPHAVKIGG